MPSLKRRSPNHAARSHHRAQSYWYTHTHRHTHFDVLCSSQGQNECLMFLWTLPAPSLWFKHTNIFQELGTLLLGQDLIYNSLTGAQTCWCHVCMFCVWESGVLHLLLVSFLALTFWPHQQEITITCSLMPAAGVCLFYMLLLLLYSHLQYCHLLS